MSWLIYGDPFTDSEFTNGEKTIRFKCTKNLLIKYVRTSIINYNDASFTNVTMKIYYDGDAEAKGGLLYSSSSTKTKAGLFTKTNGITNTYFQFNEVPITKDVYYHIALLGTGAAFTDSSYLAWKTSYPYPSNGGFSPSFRSLPQFPYEFDIVGAEF